ncbi:peptide/nickel transport system ATP-binding protein/oligopeptide transport system ATP-binding protein [Desulfosalsimonas propionicica]|uniref:Peptide/nickel transport system ATP-binding protein/oligopeptide transport system ATP-binding protein n=1 Tax=Desulfosalsimonas propionicica TaxID=332175 RepID=A0A7W0C8Y3_9BACT|nr:ABC transporter ATP-binding protein [Desulfosalsimonas propionicica]MBA2881244.1 peptide/nickel transport system ATP-binding protein/oligopeptide transport system ATP-binding protein [Desulfosalsimonas propionicica]
MKALLSVDNLAIEFATDEGVIRAVDGVSFAIRAGESLGLVGESGCGKSVTALGLIRLIASPPGRIVSGSVHFDGRELLQINTRDLRAVRGNEISMIFQEPLSALSPLHRIGRQLTEAIGFHHRMSKKAAREYAVSWLQKVGIPDAQSRMDAYPFQLSGGMQQRVMIAMALMLSPKLVIADEPTTALDVTTQAQIFAKIREMKENRTSLLLITHDMGVVWEMCDRVIVMYASRIVETADIETLFAAPAHPYTRGLMAAIPKLAGGRNHLTDIPGQVPSPLDYPAGCRFQDRCPDVFERCRTQDPDLVTCGKDHLAACFLVYPDKGA